MATANVSNLSKGSDFLQIQQYDTELTQSRDINEHGSFNVNHLEHYSTERNLLFVDRTEKHSEFKLTGRR